MIYVCGLDNSGELGSSETLYQSPSTSGQSRLGTRSAYGEDEEGRILGVDGMWGSPFSDIMPDILVFPVGIDVENRVSVLDREPGPELDLMFPLLPSGAVALPLDDLVEHAEQVGLGGIVDGSPQSLLVALWMEGPPCSLPDTSGNYPWHLVTLTIDPPDSLCAIPHPLRQELEPVPYVYLAVRLAPPEGIAVSRELSGPPPHARGPAGVLDVILEEPLQLLDILAFGHDIQVDHR